MNKDVIYIDVEDDITAVIGKVKDAKEKIVALVPPKRIGVLQSAVNLRLLARAAEQSDKRLVLISSNSALAALAAAAKVPVAKNLQSKPELAEIAALDIDNGEDIIDGAQLPVGELARTADSNSLAAAAFADPAIKDVTGTGAAGIGSRATPPAPGESPRKPKPKSGMGVPNFNKFRKKLIFIIGGGVLLLAFLVWAVFFAAKATVVITARTTDTSANVKVSLGNTLTTSATANTLKSTVQQAKKDVSVDFDATGTKDVGEKSQGQIVFKNCETMTAQTIPAGTTVSANGRNYLTQSSVSVPGGTGGFGGCSSPGVSSAVAIAAQAVGEEYNTPSNTSFTTAGHTSGSSTQYFNANASTDITGGSKRQIKVVSASDIQKATDQLAQQNTDAMKKQLSGQFNNDFVVIDQSFKVDRGSPQASPAVDQEAASGKAKLTSNVTYSLSGLARSDVNNFLTDHFNKQLGSNNDQRVYDNGAKKVTFTNVTAADSGFTASMVATAKIGPKIDDEAIKNQAKGKRYGDIQSSIESIQGVDNVDVKFWPFWVSSAPDDTKKISVEFNLE
ncbi:MAG TPA: hypothetical protein VK502_01375 [Candidatus Saccharimonadales bacterium]|nr:hypothetical protein [Candidatus Saccharimonadales bacterium]